MSWDNKKMPTGGAGKREKDRRQKERARELDARTAEPTRENLRRG